MCVLSHQAQLGKESACSAGGLGSIPGLGRSPGERKGYLLQYSGLENPMVCIVHEVTKSWTRLNDFHFHFTKSLQSCPTLWDPTDCSLPGSSIHGNSPGKNTGVGCHAFFQGIFPTQVLNPSLLHCRRILYHKANSSRGHKNSSCLYIYEWNLEIYERKENPQLGSEILSLFSPQLNKLTKKSVSV